MTTRSTPSAVVVEHGTAGSAAAAPVARDIMAEAFNRDLRRRRAVRRQRVGARPAAGHERRPTSGGC